MDPSIRSLLLLLFGATLVIRTLTALSLEHAGYFDAFYYYHLALNMAEGRGLTDSVIWNFLDHPEQLPRPGNQYWMPATNLLAWAGIRTLGGLLGPWRAAQVPFVLLGSLLPPLAAWLSWQGWQRREWAASAGLLTIFSGFYFIHWVVTDNFTPFAVAVAVALLALWRAGETGHTRWWALAGLGAGLSHLCRVDGALLVPLLAGLAAWWTLRGPERSWHAFLVAGGAAAAGYLLVMAPWWARNWLVVGSPFPGGGTQTLWLRSYGEIFAYRPDLSLERYLAWGAGPILRSKLHSVVTCTFIVLGGTLFYLAPLMLLALREAARRPLFRPVLLYTALLLTAMPLIFTFPAMRGSLFHSTAALIPWMMALVPPGIERFVRWVAARRRRWKVDEGTRVLGLGAILIAAIITLYVYAGALWLPPTPNAVVPRWNDRLRLIDEVESWLASAPARPDERIFTGDPSAYYVKTGRPALIIPTDGPSVLAEAAAAWEARWLLLDADNQGAYREMYAGEAAAGWVPAVTFTDPLGQRAILFRFDP